MLNGFSPRPEVVIKATLNWYWLVDWLQEGGFNVKLAHTFGLHMITGAKVKTDDRDAFTLAKLLRIKAIRCPRFTSSPSSQGKETMRSGIVEKTWTSIYGLRSAT